MASLFQELFLLVASKYSLLPKESFIAIRTAIASRFQRQGKFSSQSGSRTLKDHQKLVGKYLSTQQRSAQVNIFVTVYPTEPKIVQVWKEKSME